MKFVKEIELKYDDLRACALFKAKQDVRFYLCGVYVGGGMVAATNGHTLLICDEPEAKDLDLIIPAEAIKSIIAKVGTKPMLSTIELKQTDSGYWLLKHFNSLELFLPVEGKYPDVKRVDIPKPEKYTAESFPQFDFGYLSDFRKVAQIYGTKASQPKLFPTTANDRCYVEIDERVHGVLMPLRT